MLSIVVAAAASFLGVFIILAPAPALVSDVLSHVALPGRACDARRVNPFIGAFMALGAVTIIIFSLSGGSRFIDAIVGIAFTVALAIGMILIRTSTPREAFFWRYQLGYKRGRAVWRGARRIAYYAYLRAFSSGLRRDIFKRTFTG